MYRRFVSLALLLAVFPTAAIAQSITRPPDGDNQRASVSQWIGLVEVTIAYNSPNVHSPTGQDRTGHIWGELVPYGLHDLGFNDCKVCPWRAGSNENTVFTVSHGVEIQGKPLAAGSYGVHMIAGQDEWTLIFSKTHTSWGSFTYDSTDDALRVTTKPSASPYHEWLTYEFTDRGTDQATCALMWENLAVPFTIKVPHIEDLYVEQMGRELGGSHWFSWTNWQTAAQYCLEHKSHLDRGLGWAQHAVSGEFVGTENFTTLTTLAQLQLANGKRDEARKTVARAMSGGSPGVVAMHTFARQLQVAEENTLAMDVFMANAKKHPGVWPVEVGLARAFAIAGDMKKAMAHARLALAQAPNEPNRKNVEGLIKQWETAAAAK